MDTISAVTWETISGLIFFQSLIQLLFCNHFREITDGLSDFPTSLPLALSLGNSMYVVASCLSIFLFSFLSLISGIMLVNYLQYGALLLVLKTFTKWLLLWGIFQYSWFWSFESIERSYLLNLLAMRSCCFFGTLSKYFLWYLFSLSHRIPGGPVVYNNYVTLGYNGTNSITHSVENDKLSKPLFATFNNIK